MNLVQAGSISLGCDPEAFLMKDGKVIGSEKVIPEAGFSDSYGGKIIRDGVQAEFNLPYSYDVKNVGNYLSLLFSTLGSKLTKFEGVSISMKEVVEVDKEELDSLAPESRVLGCAPSYNVYGENPIVVDGDFRTRSAGGHIHLGLVEPIWDRYDSRFDERWRLVPILDAILGSTSVLINGGEEQRTRRKTYGRAGEHRLPSFGLEYRVLSNFWVRDYILTELVMGLAKMGVDILYTSLSKKGDDLETNLMERFDLKKIESAINDNDPVLALENWGHFKEFIKELKIDGRDRGYGIPRIEYPINKDNLNKVDEFFKVIGTKGLDNMFPEDKVMEGWKGFDVYKASGSWFRFLEAFK